jgi:hypothetical protein
MLNQYWEFWFSCKGKIQHKYFINIPVPNHYFKQQEDALTVRNVTDTAETDFAYFWSEQAIYKTLFTSSSGPKTRVSVPWKRMKIIWYAFYLFLVNALGHGPRRDYIVHDALWQRFRHLQYKI